MGLWNDVDVQKVTMMKLAPRSENTDDTREVVCSIASSSVVHGISQSRWKKEWEKCPWRRFP